MRYLGNKRKLLHHIESCAAKLGFERGTVCDLFAGTGVVGRHFRERGSRVLSTDLMNCSYVFQRLFLEWEEWPTFAQLRRELDLSGLPAAEDRLSSGTTLSGSSESLRVVISYLEQLEPEEGLLTRQYSPTGPDQRMFLRPESAGRLDHILGKAKEWAARGWIDEPELYFLLALAIDAADRVANISGTYGAYLKSWQQNSSQPIQLRVPRLVAGPRGSGHRQDASEWLGTVEADLLYMDPPYNNRQYPANYNMLEVMARIPLEADLASFESSIYGKTGLVPWKDRSSKLCSRRGTECRDAFRELLRTTGIPRVVISYNEEGIIQREEFEDMLAEYAGVPVSRLGECLTEVSYARFRSDADGRISSTGAGRSYKQLPDRDPNEVREWLFHVKRS